MKNRNRSNGKGAESTGNYFDMLTPQEGHNSLKEFTTTPDSPREILQKSYFPDEDKALACCQLLYHFDEFEMPESCDQLLLDCQAAWCSVGGMSTNKLLMAWTGVIAPQLLKLVSGTEQNQKRKVGKLFRKEDDKYPVDERE
jgi:hypothetical protein